MNSDQNPNSITPGGRSPVGGLQGAVPAVAGPPGPPTVTPTGTSEGPNAPEDNPAVRKDGNK